MFKRLAVGSASLVALAFASAAPASAAPSGGPSFTGARLSCPVPVAEGEAAWNVDVAVGSRSFAGVSKVDYELRLERRSPVAMPIGKGAIQAALYEEWFDGELIVSQNRASVPESERVSCQNPYNFSLADMVYELRYVKHPVRPTYAQVETFCEVEAPKQTSSSWELDNCLPILSERAGVSAPAPK